MSAEPKKPKTKPKTKWDPKKPRENLSALFPDIKSLTISARISAGRAIRRVISQEMGREAYDNLASQNKSPCTNEQKRLLLLTLQSYTKYIAREKQEQKRQEEEKEERERLENLCKRCGVRAHDTINLPCHCETFCQACAETVIKEKGKCTECNARVRSCYGEDEPFRVMCGSCGFTWNGNPQHMCDGEERTIRVPKTLAGVNTQVVSSKIEETLQGWPFHKQEEFDRDLYEQEYSIQLIDDCMEELALELDKEGILLVQSGNRGWMLEYTVQIKEGSKISFN